MSGEAEKTERAYVYMVRCAGGQLYTGWTNDPASRLHAHKSGKGAKCTRALGAQRFAYLERCTDKSAALRREAALKKLTKAQKEALCAEWAEKNLPRLSLATHSKQSGLYSPSNRAGSVAYTRLRRAKYFWKASWKGYLSRSQSSSRFSSHSRKCPSSLPMKLSFLPGCIYI